MNLPDKIVLRPLDKLIPYARNARTHDDAQVAQIAASLREFGWTNPVLIDGDGGIIAGHGRVLAARKLGIIDVPCIELAHLTETQRRAYILADNQLALNAGWDNELLKIELADLKLADFDLNLTGFDLSALNLDGDDSEGGDAEPTDDKGIDYEEKYAVLVECQDEADQAEVFERLQGMGLTCKVLVN